MRRRALLTGMTAALAATTLGATFPVAVMAADAAPSNIFIVASVRHCAKISELVEGNYRTILWQFMDRITVENGGIAKWETAKVGSKAYDQWLREPHNRAKPDFIPPHVQFGGAVKSTPVGDPKFYDGWVELRRAVPINQYWV